MEDFTVCVKSRLVNMDFKSTADLFLLFFGTISKCQVFFIIREKTIHT